MVVIGERFNVTRAPIIGFAAVFFLLETGKMSGNVGSGSMGKECPFQGRHPLQGFALIDKVISL
tara:strand:- start:117 stop:308 length:192 start_codon:yes stop_codon:yes gene_type:complete